MFTSWNFSYKRPYVIPHFDTDLKYFPECFFIFFHNISSTVYTIIKKKSISRKKWFFLLFLDLLYFYKNKSASKTKQSLYSSSTLRLQKQTLLLTITERKLMTQKKQKTKNKPMGFSDSTFERCWNDINVSNQQNRSNTKTKSGSQSPMKSVETKRSGSKNCLVRN